MKMDKIDTIFLIVVILYVDITACRSDCYDLGKGWTKCDDIRDIKKLTSEQKSRISQLYITKTNIRKLWKGMFDGFDNLLKQNFGYNKIKKLEKGVFDGLNKLKYLYLNFNKITKLEKGVFDGLNKLKYLLLPGNQITKLEKGVFDGLNELTHLYLHGNQITKLEKGVFDGLNELTHLYMEYNQITKLEKGVFDGLNELTLLQLENNQITKLEQGVFNGLTNLTSLDLEDNQITKWEQGVLNGLNKLASLDLEGNQITKLEQGVFNGLDKVRRLDLRRNPFTDDVASITRSVFKSLASFRQKMYEEGVWTNPCDAGNGGCTDTCTNDNGVAVCSCDDGIELDDDKRTCIRANPCDAGNGGCTDTCTDDKGVAVCSCDDGMELDDDKKTCIRALYSGLECIFKHGGGSDYTYIGRYEETECINACIEKKTIDSTINGVERQVYPPTNDCWCLRNMPNRNDGTRYKSCVLEKNTPSNCGRKNDIHARNVGGKGSNLGEWPWQVGLYISKEYRKDHPIHPTCGGTIISSNVVLSAAHCFNYESRPEYVRVGDTNRLRNESQEEMVGIQRVVMHPNYSGESFQNDVAIIFLKKHLNLTQNVFPACLPFNSTTEDYSDCYVTGWGTLSYKGVQPYRLQKAKVPIVAQRICEEAYENENRTILSGMLCAGYPDGTIDTCQGDSGGPLVCEKNGRWDLVGITSWGYKCASAGKYGVYASVLHYLDYIRKYL